MLLTHHISKFTTASGYQSDLEVTYQLFGRTLNTAPVVLVNHALTGNSSVTGNKGWWNSLIGPDKAINTHHFTILAIDIPGNGYDGKAHNLITNYKEFHLRDIAQIQLQLIDALEISNLFAVIGGSLGGQLAWEFALVAPEKVENLIPIATDWKATDWVIAQTKVQEQILLNSKEPIADARMHAMTFYRTPASFKLKFNRQKQEGQSCYQIESWLTHHGKKLTERCNLATYKLMNHLLGIGDVTKGETSFKTIVAAIKAKIHLVAIDTDGLFLADEIYETHIQLKEVGVVSEYHEIKSKHGHDAFLIEYDQLSAIIKPIFQKQLCYK